MVGERTLVRVDLVQREREEDTPETDLARFSLWVDEASLLVHRVTASQRLPDGARYATTVVIDVALAD